MEKEEKIVKDITFYRKDRLIVSMNKLIPIMLVLLIILPIIGTIIFEVRSIIIGSTVVSVLLFSIYCIIFLKNNPDKFYKVDE